MRHLLPVASLLLLASTAACSGSSAAHPTPPGSPPDVPVAQLDIPRDSAASISPATVAGAVAANNAFAFDLYGHVLASQPAGNALTSPISASLALTMTYAGAQGQTATEMATALHYGAAAGAIFDGQNGLSQALASRGAAALASAQNQPGAAPGQTPPDPADYQLQVVNSVWGEQTYPWATPFLTTLAKSYGAGVYLEDFVHQWDPARQAINAWVSTETNDKINDLLTPGSLDDTTRLVLVNAIHLKLPWASPFQVAATAAAPFTRADGSTVSAPFMNQTEELAYTDDGAAQIVALPLAGGQVSVVIALPHGDLAAYEAGLSASTPNALVPPTAGQSVALSLPKVTFTSPTFSLASSLQAMGMVQAFDPSAANFTGMCPSTPDGDTLYIGDVLQKATVAMQETGVEAAAATAVIVGGASVAEPAPVPMVVNRPFVLAIVDVPTGALLFLGHVEDPTDAGSP
ncbi:MAG TPA: serpin family protein [Polyangiaceae bacterium]|jgi:serpin B